MSRHYPHPLTNHGNNYKASDGPRDQQNKIITSDPARYSSKDFSRDYSYEGILRYESHNRPRLPASSIPLLPPPNLKGSMPEGLWRHTTAQIEAMEAENTRLARRTAEGSKPSGRRRKKPVREQRMNFQLANLFLKRANLHGQHQRSTVTLLNTQNPDMGNVSQG